MAETAATGTPPAAEAPLEALLAALSASTDGLTSAEAAARLKRHGPNEIAERRAHPLLKALSYFWGPIPWMIETAAALAAVVGDDADLAIILVLLVFNAAVGFHQEHQAESAIAQLKRQLALKARARRDGGWTLVDARELVPGDVVRVRLGDVLPADVKLFAGDYLSVDQSALTGESLPVEKRPGDAAWSGSVARQGEMTGLVTATGMETYFGRTAALVAEAAPVSHFQRAVLTIGDYLIYLTLGLAAVLFLVQIHRGEPLLKVLEFALVLTVAAIPVAMPAVLSVTMAVGAVVLSKMRAIVSRLESIEEMAGMDVLCSDKTGTLTQNRLTLGETVPVAALDAPELIRAAALACDPEAPDPIDTAVLEGLEGGAESLSAYTRERFVPFDPVSKRTEAAVRDRQGTAFSVTKGAPQVVLALCEPDPDLKARVEARVDGLARKGYRTLGVGRSDDGRTWRFLGLLSLFDPPREDAAATLAQAGEHGIDVKMVTGDNLAIAREVAGRLGLGENILPAERVPAEGAAGGGAEVERADGFAQVFPEHKYALVRALQGKGHLVGMTGDGVNDAPALKQAEVGIAVAGATDAARAAADLVLTAPGLSVIVRAVEEARRIFERMTSYAVYRITETIRIMIFLVLAMLVYGTYPVTAVMIILLALLNDLPIMTIAYDNTRLDPQPVRWDMRRVLTVATVLGGVGVIETFGLLFIARTWFGVSGAELQSVIFLKLVVAGHLTLLVARTKGPFFSSPRPAPVLFGAILGTQAVAACIVGFGWLVAPIPWSFVGMIWAYCLVWLLVEDGAKMAVYRHLDLAGARHHRFLRVASGHLGHGADVLHGRRRGRGR
jgi:H+-transporting ATPase